MATTFRWLMRLFLALAAVTALSGIAIYYVASRSLPDYNATHHVEGLQAPMEIVRTNADVPHIFGANDADVYFGLGFAHAQDRLWQMMLLRRTAQGRLSEIFGARTLAYDSLIRRLDLYRLAVSSVAAQDAYAKAALESYSRGVNAWLTEVNKGALGRGAPEFFLFTNAMAPWQPADSIAILKLLAWEQSEQAAGESLRAQTSLLLPDDRLRDILPDAPGPGIATLPDYASLVPGLDGLRFAEDQTEDTRRPGLLARLLGETAADGYDPLSPIPHPGRQGASNAWAAAPSRSASGGTLLASDPHMAYSAPTIWYLARLELASGGVIGATVPGLPLILEGRTDRFGWGLTAAFIDDQDLHVEKLNPDDPTQVATPDGFVPLRHRASIVEIKDSAPVTLDLTWTPNGPVLPGDVMNLARITPRGHVMSLSWTGLSPDDTTISAGLRLMRSASLAEGIAAGAAWVAPGMNVIMAEGADAEGVGPDGPGIALKTFGAVPRRDPQHQSKGRLPSPGWIGANLWLGVQPYASNPEFVNPAGGLLGNTNNKLLNRPFPQHVSYLWGDTQRIQRWRRLMQSREVHTRESFIEAQLDTVSPTARTLLPLVGADLWFTGEAAPEGTPERLRQDALQLLADWNGEMNEHLPEPLIYAAWMRALQERLIRDELGPLARQFTHLDPVFIERVYTDQDGASAWCDILQSAAIETCTDIARLALDDALVWIGDHYGKDLTSLRWGNAHEAAQDHQVLGESPLVKYLVNIRQSTSGGDNTLMMGRTLGSGPNPFESVAGATYRGVYDFADPDSSVFIISTGQSGHPLSRHYDDLGVLWRRGEYIPMSLDPDLARAAAVGITELLPAD
ncbi:penicillin acylase family protein [Frigidibacter sp. ROC022]|uniref:penicillin acylase family protein n=1 Tax=Frigidibacter sp. ROC022 TaxID=2971796 RepID=UPI00215A5BA9|nr:penicillin acylase family protein [Frigidibacter sp. ROC022]MCR8723454.1 penicillin acylase family protein [Frigidibacter sp. ROC022]